MVKENDHRPYYCALHTIIMRLTAASQRQRLFCCGLLLVLLFTASAMLMVARFFCSQNSSCSSCLSRSFATTTSTTTESVGIIENVAKEGSTTATKNEMPSPVSAATTTLITETQYYLNDRTIRLSPYVDRSWLRLNSNVFAEQRNQSSTTASATTSTIPEPKVKLILTDFGWNHPIHGIKFSRTLRSRELLQAFIDHPYFDPTFRWSEQMEHAAAASASASNNNQNEYQYFDPSVTYIVMFDLETTFESNYPHYRPSQDIQVNSDLLQGRKWKRHEQEGTFVCCNCDCILGFFCGIATPDPTLILFFFFLLLVSVLETIKIVDNFILVSVISRAL